MVYLFKFSNLWRIPSFQSYDRFSAKEGPVIKYLTNDFNDAINKSKCRKGCEQAALNYVKACIRKTDHRTTTRKHTYKHL